jgi:hypothetical protein
VRLSPFRAERFVNIGRRDRLIGTQDYSCSHGYARWDALTMRVRRTVIITNTTELIIATRSDHLACALITFRAVGRS